MCVWRVCAGPEKTARRGGEDPTGRTTKEATGNSTNRYYVNACPIFFLLSSHSANCNPRVNE